MKKGDKVKFNLGLQRREGVVKVIHFTKDGQPTSVKVSFKTGDKEVIIKRHIVKHRVRNWGDVEMIFHWPSYLLGVAFYAVGLLVSLRW